MLVFSFPNLLSKIQNLNLKYTGLQLKEETILKKMINNNFNFSKIIKNNDFNFSMITNILILFKMKIITLSNFNGTGKKQYKYVFSIFSIKKGKKGKRILISLYYIRFSWLASFNRMGGGILGL